MIKKQYVLAIFVTLLFSIVGFRIYDEISYQNWQLENKSIVNVIETNADEVGVDAEPYKREAYETEKKGGSINYQDYSQSQMMMKSDITELLE
jgi:hypothetical protein